MNKSTGFTLIELMIVMVIIGIIMAIAVPSYQGYVLRSHRTDAHSSLLDIAARQERYVAQNVTGYTDQIVDDLNLANTNSSKGYYVLSVSDAPCTSLANCYTIIATAVGSQTNDTGCTSINYDSAGRKTPAACW